MNRISQLRRLQLAPSIALLAIGGILAPACSGTVARAQMSVLQPGNHAPTGEATISRNQLLAPGKAAQAAEHARQHILHHRLDAAQAEVSRALAIAPQFAVALAIQGELYLENQNYAGADKFFREAIEKDPSLAAAYVGLSSTLMQQKHFEEALTQLQRAETLLPGNWLVHFQIALAKLQLGDTDAAFRQAELATQFAGKQARGRAAGVFLLGLIYIKTKDTARGRELLTQAISIDPNGDIAALARQSLDRVEPLIASAK